ncbi:MAG: hypothetical protein KHX84_04420 [Enterocloster asparagiformis]|nr:hypothetical protein [Enterocloster asparagiformis]
MCKAMEDMRNEAALAERKKIAAKLLEGVKLSLEKIADVSELSLEEVRELAGKKGE